MPRKQAWFNMKKINYNVTFDWEVGWAPSLHLFCSHFQAWCGVVRDTGMPRAKGGLPGWPEEMGTRGHICQ